MPTAENDDQIQTFVFDRFYESLSEGVASGRPRRTKCDLHSRIFQDRLEGWGVFRVSVDDQMSLSVRETINAVGKGASDLLHPLFVRCQSGSADVDNARFEVDDEQSVVCQKPGAS